LLLTTNFCFAQYNPQEQANVNTFTSYFNALSSGNLGDALNYVSQTVVLRWNGNENVLPWAGNYTGKNGIVGFFTTVAKYYTVKSLAQLTIQGVSNTTVSITFLETSTALLSGRTYNLINYVLYVFDSTHLISFIDIYLDTMTVAITMLCLPQNTPSVCGSD